MPDAAAQPAQGRASAEIPITKPLFGEEELRAVQLPLESGWVVQGPYVAEFEAKVAAVAAADYGIATNSCTTALHIVVAALELGPGDEVIVPALTWVSTANVVEYLGATPVFCDVDLATFNLDVSQLGSLVTPRTVGILPVHLFGLPADMDAVMEVVQSHGLWVVEDAACALGATYGGRPVGALGDAGCFSFHPRKSVTTGEGGLIATNRVDIAEAAVSLRDHGASRSDLARHESSGRFLLSSYDRLGFNFRMTDIQGALGSVQMDRFAGILAAKRRLAARYDTLLAEVDWLRTPVVPDGSEHAYQTYVCLYAPGEPELAQVPALHERRNRVMQLLEDEGVATRQGTHAAALQGYYAGKYDLHPEDFPNAAAAEALTISLPLFPQLTDAEQDTVVERLVAAQHVLEA
jgi:perosamine synthetase